MDKKEINREMGFYFSLAQVGTEMVVPIALGAVLDHYLGWRPWAVIAGAVLGLLLGMTHLVHQLNQHDKEQKR